MCKVIVPLNAFNRNEVLEKDQASFISKIKTAGAYGVEIRRELFPEGSPNLSSIKEELEKFPLFTVYSTPVEIWLEDGSINLENLQKIFHEAKEMGASWIKVSLGHFNNNISDGRLLKEFLEKESAIQLLVENDQTKYGGSIRSFQSFFESVIKNDIPIKMTFDIGNWYYSGESVHEAIAPLKSHVMYLHLKHVENQDGHLITLPLPADESAEWRKMVGQFPQGLNRALEIPIHTMEELSYYINLVESEREFAGK